MKRSGMICVISSRSWENPLKQLTAHRWPRNERLQFLWRRADLGAQITCQLESEPSQHRDSTPPHPHPTSPYGSSLLRPLPFIEGLQKWIRVPTSQSILTAAIVDDGEPEGTIALNNIASPVN